MWSLFSNRFFLVICLICGTQTAHGNRIPDVWQVPSKNPHFIGREAYLQKISKIFQKHPSKIAILRAGPGFGKSQIAREFAHQNYFQYQIVWWFRTNQYMDPQFREFAMALAQAYRLNFAAHIQKMSLKKLRFLINDLIRKKNLKCLLIFDNVSAYAKVRDYIPHSHHNKVHILATTQNGNFSTQRISIKEFQKGEALQYVQLFLKEEPLSDQEILIKYVHNHPSTLKFAVDYITDYPGMRVKDYIDQHKKMHSLLPKGALEGAVHRENLTDDYKILLPTAVLLNLRKLKADSRKAYALLSLFTLLHWDQIQLDLLEAWLRDKYPEAVLQDLLGYIRKHGFIDDQGSTPGVGIYVGMHELIQKITGNLIPDDEKRPLMDDACQLLQATFEGRSDRVVERITHSNIPLLNAEKVLAEAIRIDYRTPSLTKLKAGVFDVLTCGLRDFEKANHILESLQQDFEQGIQLFGKDHILYLITLSLFSAIYEPNYEKAIRYGEKAFQLLKSQKNMFEEKVRLTANLIQFNSFQGELDRCAELYRQGQVFFKNSTSSSYNILFIFGTSIYLLDLGKPEEAISMIQKHQGLFEDLDGYSSMRFYALVQLAEAFIKTQQTEKALEALQQAEADAKEFYNNDRNTFFARIRIYQTLCSFKEKPIKDSIQTVQDALKIYESTYHGTDCQINQAEAYLLLGKIYDHGKEYEKACTHYKQSERVFDKLLRRKSIDNLSELYKCLAILGVKRKNEALTHTYLKKHIKHFGLKHKRTQDILLFLDERNLALPF